MKYFLTLLVIISFTSFSSAQVKKKKPNRVSFAQGTLFGYWGYNRSAYTKSNLHFEGAGYNFTLKQSKASDNPSTDIKQYVNPKTLTVPQFNARIGYYFKDHWAINFGYDHMKYIFNDNNKVLLDGYIKPGLSNEWSGEYQNEPITTNRETFHYENSNGLNYLHVEVMRTDLMFRTKNRKFAISTNLGLGAGGLLSFNDFLFAQQKDMVTISMSGYGLSAHAAIRFEFFNHLFLQPEFSGGFMHQISVKTRPDDLTAFASQKYGYCMGQVTLGFLLYTKQMSNKCDDCPKW